nr:hypothetical protein [uncultured Bacteroides sp.]
MNRKKTKQYKKQLWGHYSCYQYKIATAIHGAVLGIEESHEVHLFKTFVSFEMLKEDQTNTHDFLYDKLIDFWSEI